VDVTLRVSVPASTPDGSVVHIAGDFQGWDPASLPHALTKQPDGRWTLTLALAQGQALQFKFTRGSWATVEKGPNGEELANRTLTPGASGTWDFTVATWADLGTIVGRVESFTYAPFLSGRRCWVYLPAGYRPDGPAYPVLYMHDGQNLFDVRTAFAGEWKVDETLESLFRQQLLDPIIVVGIENGGASRITEYTPWADPGDGGGGGDAYLTAVRDVLMPEVNRRYHTRTDADHTWMCGSSLGGLISAYAGYAYASTWGRVAAVSPSYWWADGQMIDFAQAQGRPALTHFYQDMGTLEAGSLTDADHDGVDDYLEDLRAVRTVALGQGFVDGLDFMSVEAGGHTHNEYWWAQRFPVLVRFLAGPPVTAGVP
jgi:pullulanase